MKLTRNTHIDHDFFKQNNKRTSFRTASNLSVGSKHVYSVANVHILKIGMAGAQVSVYTRADATAPLHLEFAARVGASDPALGDPAPDPRAPAVQFVCGSKADPVDKKTLVDRLRRTRADKLPVGCGVVEVHLESKSTVGVPLFPRPAPCMYAHDACEARRVYMWSMKNALEQDRIYTCRGPSSFKSFCFGWAQNIKTAC